MPQSPRTKEAMTTPPPARKVGDDLPTDPAEQKELIAEILKPRRKADPDPAPGVYSIYEGDDGTILFNEDATNAFSRDVRQRAVRREAYRRRLARGRQTVAPTISARERGHEARQGSNDRTRGSRRTSSRSAGGGDPDSDEPPGGRFCECGCGADLTGRRPQTIFATEACRKRASRRNFAETDEGAATIRFLVENARLWQEITAGVAA
jgi:hypothetical protein